MRYEANHFVTRMIETITSFLKHFLLMILQIKFIVDGVWMIDPLRPIICSNGYENNLLVIT